MTVQPTLEYRRAGSDGPWARLDPAKREEWQWDSAPDWLAAEALWLLGEGSEVRLVCTGIDSAAHPHLKPEMFGDHTETECLSLNPPEDNPPVPADATYYGEPVKGAGQPNDPGTGAYVHRGEVHGMAWTNKEVAAYGNVVADNKAAGSNSPTPQEWKDQQADRKE
jgi:hypothetical protein